MPFNGSEGAPIPLADAQQYLRNFRKRPNQPVNDVHGSFFGRDILQRILATPGCMGIRIYYGLDKDNRMVPIIVGADSAENNILPTSSASLTEDDPIIGNTSTPCPPICGGDDGLNNP
jgi:hypothetical protein